MNPKTDVAASTEPLERVRSLIGETAAPEVVEVLQSFAQALLGRAPADFFRDRTDEQLVELVSTVFEHLDSTPWGEISVRVKMLPGAGHSGTVELMIDDRPFVVDTLRQYLTSKGFEIRHELHPVIVVDRDREGKVSAVLDWTALGRRVAVAYCEFIGHLDDKITHTLQEEIRRCMEDVRLATDDFQPMLEQVDRLKEELTAIGDKFRHRNSEVREIVAFLEWLKDGGFIFLGYRTYNFWDDTDGVQMVAVERGSGLGILRREAASTVYEARPMSDLPPDLQVRALHGPLLLVSKANAESRVHRRARMDYIGIKKLNQRGEVEGEHRFLGLFTWKAYSENAGDIPILRQKLRQILEEESVPEGSHDYKAIVALFNGIPKEELFLVGIEDLRKQIAAVMAAEDTGDVRLVITPDVLERGVNVMVLLPKRNYTDEVRGRLRSVLSGELGGSVLNDHLTLGEGDSARLHFYISAAPERVVDLDIEALQNEVASIVRTWKQRLRGALGERHVVEDAHRLAETYLDAFTPEYMATIDVDTAVEDIDRLERLETTGNMQLALEPQAGNGLDASKLRLFVKRGTMILADVMPILENLSLRVIQAYVMDVGGAGNGAATIHSFVVQGPDSRPLEDARIGVLLCETLLAVHLGLADNDRFNALVLPASLAWPEIAVLRAYSAYAFQIGAVSSRRAVLDALTEHPETSRLLFEVFRVKFDPQFEGDRPAAAQAARSAFRDSLRMVESISHDLTFRRLFNLVEATVRTSYFQPRVRGRDVPFISLKFDCAAIAQMPYPRPAREMFVHGARTEGAHLRFGPVARGGLRWSERSDDFRTEVLGLVKTQQVKNAVIVPVGAKGAFVVRRPPADRAALKGAVLDSYRDFVRGLLDLTDNIVDGKVRIPPDTVVYDGEDPYLVVAADKGTARFSDEANAIAAEYDFWTGDAFASGGSHGYDHKKEAITARGTWQCVQRHFRELEKDISTGPITVVGIGDMSGDVFGNGMLLSRTIRLVAAFDHRHIFIDPEPDPERSYKERERLFQLPGSTWADYDAAAISEGGGVYLREAKEIRLSEQARRLLGVHEDVINGRAAVRAILRAPTELLWNGGIGTYVKATGETHAEVGDSSNDAVRIDASELKAQIVGEGGNLGLTQLARIEFALKGGRADTDAVDNSAGVDMSDHEVNLKILLRSPVDRGDLTDAERNELLDLVTDEVAESVLANNRAQSRALSLEQTRAVERLSEFRDAMYFLESRAGLNRALEFLPSWERLQERQETGKTLTRPELAVLLAYSKMLLKSNVLSSTIPDDPALVQLLTDYYPAPVIERVSEEDLRGHRLQREIIATVLTNRIVDLMGSSFIPRVVRDTGAMPAAVARGWYVAAEIAGAKEVVEEIEKSEASLPVSQEYQWLLALEGVLDRTVRWAVENLPEDGEIGGAIEKFKQPVAELCDILPSIILGSQKAIFEEALEELKVSGVAGEVAQRIAALKFLGELMEITRISSEVGFSVADVGRVYFALADEVDFAWLLDLLEMAPGEDVWEQRAAQGLMQDLGQARRNLSLTVLASGGRDDAVGARLEAFRRREAARVGGMREVLQELLISENINLAALTVATREILRQSQAALDACHH